MSARVQRTVAMIDETPPPNGQQAVDEVWELYGGRHLPNRFGRPVSTTRDNRRDTAVVQTPEMVIFVLGLAALVRCVARRFTFRARVCPSLFCVLVFECVQRPFPPSEGLSFFSCAGLYVLCVYFLFLFVQKTTVDTADGTYCRVYELRTPTFPFQAPSPICVFRFGLRAPNKFHSGK